MDPTLRNRRPILIVDDDAALVDLLVSVLHEAHYPVAVCHDSRLAAEQVHALQPVALLLDLRMPHVDGWTVLRAVRATPAGRDLPVVLMSGAWRPHETKRAIGTSDRLAPTLVLPKPFALGDLDACLHQLGV